MSSRDILASNSSNSLSRISFICASSRRSEVSYPVIFFNVSFRFVLNSGTTSAIFPNAVEWMPPVKPSSNVFRLASAGFVSMTRLLAGDGTAWSSCVYCIWIALTGLGLSTVIAFFNVG